MDGAREERTTVQASKLRICCGLSACAGGRAEHRRARHPRAAWLVRRCAHRRGPLRGIWPRKTPKRPTSRPISVPRARDPKDQALSVSDRTASLGPLVASISHPFLRVAPRTKYRAATCDRERAPLTGHNPKGSQWPSQKDRCIRSIANPRTIGAKCRASLSAQCVVRGPSRRSDEPLAGSLVLAAGLRALLGLAARAGRFDLDRRRGLR
jgi:hypothetical protein